MKSKTGTQFESECMKVFKDLGFWVARLNPNSDGSQPADLLLIRNKGFGLPTITILADCKLLSSSPRFPFSRIEENQRIASDYAKDVAPSIAYWFVFGHDGKITVMSMEEILIMEKRGAKSVDVRELSSLEDLSKSLDAVDSLGKR